MNLICSFNFYGHTTFNYYFPCRSGSRMHSAEMCFPIRLRLHGCDSLYRAAPDVLLACVRTSAELMQTNVLDSLGNVRQNGKLDKKKSVRPINSLRKSSQIWVRMSFSSLTDSKYTLRRERTANTTISELHLHYCCECTSVINRENKMR